MEAAVAEIVRVLIAETAVIRVEGEGFWMIDPEFPDVTALHVYFDAAAAVEHFGDRLEAPKEPEPPTFEALEADRARYFSSRRGR